MSKLFVGLATCFVCLAPAPVQAHLVSTGFGPFYDGISHLLLSPDDLLVVIGLALLAGLGGARHGRSTLFVLPAAWLAAGMLGLQASLEVAWPVANTVSFLVVGALVAADREFAPTVVTALAVVAGGLHGYLNGTAMAQSGNGALALAGIATTVFVITAVAAAFVTTLRAAWARIVVRVAGSWIAAIGLLMLGWTVRGGG